MSKPELNGTIYDGPLVEDVSRAELVDNFVGWEPQVQTILEVRSHVSISRGSEADPRMNHS